MNGSIGVDFKPICALLQPKELRRPRMMRHILRNRSAKELADARRAAKNSTEPAVTA